jgi:hypothetical protein
MYKRSHSIFSDTVVKSFGHLMMWLVTGDSSENEFKHFIHCVAIYPRTDVADSEDRRLRRGSSSSLKARAMDSDWPIRAEIAI